MPHIGRQEDDQQEFKEVWTPKALEDLAAFANHRGGTLWIGVRDDGTIVGCQLSDADYQQIVNQLVDVLGMRPVVRREILDGVEVISITATPAGIPVTYKGRYYTRVGSTNRTMASDQLSRRFLETSGQTWDALLSPWGTDTIDKRLVERFVRLAQARLPMASGDDIARVLQNLQLLREDRLTNAAVLLFTAEPQRLFTLAQVRIGRFQGANILDSHDFSHSLWEQVDEAMARFQAMLDVRFEIQVEEASLEGLQRREIWSYPREALREALLNALIHRDYTVTADVQIRVLDDQLSIWSPGALPANMTPAQLYQPGHPSILRNPLIAQVFYYAGLIERWGSGTTRIVDLCVEQDLPTPSFEEYSGGVRVTFYQDPYNPARLQELGLGERQVRAVRYAKEHGKITNLAYQELTGVSKRQASTDLGELEEKGVLDRIGTTGRGTHYILKGA